VNAVHADAATGDNAVTLTTTVRTSGPLTRDASGRNRLTVVRAAG